MMLVNMGGAYVALGDDPEGDRGSRPGHLPANGPSQLAIAKPWHE